MSRQAPFGPDTIPYDLLLFVNLIAGEHYVVFPRALSVNEFRAMIQLGRDIAVSLSCIDGGTWKGTPKKEERT